LYLYFAEVVQMRKNGKITSWDDERGFGFISSPSRDSKTFVHIKAFRNRERRPAIGDTVTYNESKDGRGRICAVEVDLLERDSETRGKNGGIPLSFIFLFIYFAVVTSSIAEERLPAGIMLVYIPISILTYLVYAEDKSASQTGRWRTSELLLHLLSIAGGWPGAIVAQERLRHKSSKRSFRNIFWITVALNSAGLFWLTTDSGKRMMESISYILGL
jgi:uncharacterized membrane protein YsdA (DUF1294 family)/cold shock CspA family protein